jgi:DnaJ-class molecular chaperone
MHTNGQYKDFYKLLGVDKNASHDAIEYAYKMLSLKWHPERNIGNHAYASRVFNDITQAFLVLSNQARRDHYDQLTGPQFTKTEALSSFDKFFKYNGVEGEEKEFFDKLYPEHKPNYYELLGVRRDASFEEVDEAYRSKGFDLHPMNRPEDPNAERNFFELSKAYATLMNADKRRIYDNLDSGEFPSPYAHRQFVEKVQGCLDFNNNEKNKGLSGLVKKLSHKG